MGLCLTKICCSWLLLFQILLEFAYSQPSKLQAVLKTNYLENWAEILRSCCSEHRTVISVLTAILKQICTWYKYVSGYTSSSCLGMDVIGKLVEDCYERSRSRFTCAPGSFNDINDLNYRANVLSPLSSPAYSCTLALNECLYIECAERRKLAGERAPNKVLPNHLICNNETCLHTCLSKRTLESP